MLSTMVEMNIFTYLSPTWNRSFPQARKMVEIKKLQEGAKRLPHHELHVFDLG